MFILMIAALLVGFIIGWILRRSAYRSRYENQIDALKIEDDDLTTELNVNAVKLENSQKQLSQTQEKITSQKELINDFDTKSKTVQSDIENLKQTHLSLQGDLQSMDGKIRASSHELGILNTHKDEILEDKSQIINYETKMAEKSQEIENVSEKITALIDDRESLNRQITNMHASIEEKEKEVETEAAKIKEIENKFETKNAEIAADVAENKRKSINYKYAFEYINEKISANEQIEFDVVDKIISKNEEKGLFANLSKKLFGKSAKYIKEGK